MIKKILKGVVLGSAATAIVFGLAVRGLMWVIAHDTYDINRVLEHERVMDQAAAEIRAQQ